MNAFESPLSISLDRTRQLHHRLADNIPAASDDYAAALEHANRAMVEQGIRLNRFKPLEISLSALLLTAADMQRLRGFANTMHGIVEQLLQQLNDEPDELARRFPEHRRILPFLQRTAGVESWQVVSRYDVAVTPDGDLKLMELNTGCPGALMISAAVSQVSRLAFQQLGADLTADFDRVGTVIPARYIDRLLAIEQRSGIEPAGIALLTDENELSFELDLLERALRDRNREVVIADARRLQLTEGRLIAEGRPVSLTCNKFRISTPNSPNHCWREGFEGRYAAFLTAQREKQVVSINNLCGMTIAEDKSLLSLLWDEHYLSRMAPEQRRFVEQHVLWTQPLDDRTVTWEGESTELLPLVQSNRERFVIKPANEGRGYAVVVGKWADASEWHRACVMDPNMPKIVQQYTEAAQFPVVCNNEHGLRALPMFLTLGLAIVDSQFQGIISRISANPVTQRLRPGGVLPQRLVSFQILGLHIGHIDMRSRFFQRKRQQSRDN